MSQQLHTTLRDITANDLLNHQYTMMVEMYQNRYNPNHFPFNVTWHHISYWRKCVTLIGYQLIELGQITRQQYLQQKFTVVNASQIEIERSNITRHTLLNDVAYDR